MKQKVAVWKVGNRGYKKKNLEEAAAITVAPNEKDEVRGTILVATCSGGLAKLICPVYCKL